MFTKTIVSLAVSTSLLMVGEAISQGIIIGASVNPTELQGLGGITYPTSINDKGEIVGNGSPISGTYRPNRPLYWSPGNQVPVDIFKSGFFSMEWTSYINNLGQIVGWSGNADGTWRNLGVIWSNNRQDHLEIGTVDTRIFLNKINNLGSAIGTFQNPNDNPFTGSTGVYYTPDLGLVHLQVPVPETILSSGISDINDENQMVGTYTTPNIYGFSKVFATDVNNTFFKIPPFEYGHLNRINNEGWSVGSVIEVPTLGGSYSRAIIWNVNTEEIIDDFCKSADDPDCFFNALFINNNGKVLMRSGEPKLAIFDIENRSLKYVPSECYSPVSFNDHDQLVLNCGDYRPIFIHGNVHRELLPLSGDDGAYVRGMNNLGEVIGESFKTSQRDLTKKPVVWKTDIPPPTITSVTASPSTLWPPNHKMVNITINAEVKDDSGLPVTLSATVASNEPQNGLGDGDTAPDWTEPVIDQQTGVIKLKLRAERSGSGNGRIYTVTITATDASGNASTALVEILVPHDKGRK